MQFSRTLAAALLSVGLLACQGRTATETSNLSRAQFIAVLVQLHAAQIAATDPADFDTRKATVLRNAGITAEDLTRYVRAHAEDVTMMMEVWDTVHQRLGGDTGRTIVE